MLKTKSCGFVVFCRIINAFEVSTVHMALMFCAEKSKKIGVPQDLETKALSTSETAMTVKLSTRLGGSEHYTLEQF